LDISRFSFLTPSLLAFRGINQKKIDNKKKKQEKDKKKVQKIQNKPKSTIKSEETENTRWETNQPKGYTAVNGYFVFNAVAQLGPGIQK
jgi:ribosomal protein L9